jgi:hypothetical protein
LARSRASCRPQPESTKNTISSSQAVRHPPLLLHSLLTAKTSGRRCCRLCRRRPSCRRRSRPAHPHTRGGPSNIKQSRSHTARALHLASRAGLAHCARAQQPSKRRPRGALCRRTVWTMSRGWWKCQLYVSPCSSGKTKITNSAGRCIRYLGAS